MVQQIENINLSGPVLYDKTAQFNANLIHKIAPECNREYMTRSVDSIPHSTHTHTHTEYMKNDIHIRTQTDHKGTRKTM